MPATLHAFSHFILSPQSVWFCSYPHFPDDTAEVENSHLQNQCSSPLSCCFPHNHRNQEIISIWIIIIIIDNIQAYYTWGSILSILHIVIHLIITATLTCSYHLQMMQVRHKEVRWHAQGHTAGMWLGCDLNPYNLAAEVGPLNHSDALLL